MALRSRWRRFESCRGRSWFWLDSRKPQLSPATTDRYRVAIKHIDPVIGSTKVARPRPHHIEDLYGALYAQGQSGSSIRKAHWALRQSLAWAHRRGYSSIIATDGIELPPLGAKEIEPPILSQRAQGD